jgi:hypothetical protein
MCSWAWMVFIWEKKYPGWEVLCTSRTVAHVILRSSTNESLRPTDELHWAGCFYVLGGIVLHGKGELVPGPPQIFLASLLHGYYILGHIYHRYMTRFWSSGGNGCTHAMHALGQVLSY